MELPLEILQWNVIRGTLSYPNRFRGSIWKKKVSKFDIRDGVQANWLPGMEETTDASRETLCAGREQGWRKSWTMQWRTRKRRLLFWRSENLTLDIPISTDLSDALKRLRTCISVHLRSIFYFYKYGFSARFRNRYCNPLLNLMAKLKGPGWGLLLP